MVSIVIFATVASVLYAADTYCDETRECEGLSQLSQRDMYCRGYQSCKDSTLILALGDAMIHGFAGAEGATISAADVEAYGEDALLNAKVTASSDVKLYGTESGMGATITTPIVFAYGYRSASGASIKTQTAALNVKLYGYGAGYNTQIECFSGDTCTVQCLADACHVSSNPTILYCYNGAICKPVCEDETQCPDIIGGPDESLTDPQIHEIYLRDRKRIENNLRKPQSYEYKPKDVSKWILSFSASQFTVLCVLNALFVFAAVGLCLWNISTAKNKTEFAEKVDFE